MIGAPNSLNLNSKVRVTKEAPGPSVSEEIADIFTNYNIDTYACNKMADNCSRMMQYIRPINWTNPNPVYHWAVLYDDHEGVKEYQLSILLAWLKLG